MARRTIRGVVGALGIVALLLMAAPARAWTERSEHRRAAELPAWAFAWEAAVDLWHAAQDTLRAAIAAAAGAEATPSGVAGAGDDRADCSIRPIKSEEGGGLDPDG